MDSKKLLNWRQISALLNLSKDTMRANRISDIHKDKISELLNLIDNWKNKYKLK